jgi:hypothetical protein
MKAIRPDLYRLEPHFNIIMRKDATADQRVDAFVKEISRLCRSLQPWSFRRAATAAAKPIRDAASETRNQL